MNGPQELQGAGTMPLEGTLRYATSLAELLRQLHRDGAFCGHLHPDVIEWDNQCVKLVHQGAEGDAAYLAPEQVRGEATDARSDIFAFGAIVYS
jgi:serine/threonine protein kinase